MAGSVATEAVDGITVGERYRLDGNLVRPGQPYGGSAMASLGALTRGRAIGR